MVVTCHTMLLKVLHSRQGKMDFEKKKKNAKLSWCFNSDLKYTSIYTLQYTNIYIHMYCAGLTCGQRHNTKPCKGHQYIMKPEADSSQDGCY